MMSDTLAVQVCRRYGLGMSVTLPSVVTGGLLHRMYRLETDQGCYAVKILDAGIMRKPGVQDEFRRAERIAKLFASAGVPAVTALDLEGDTVQDVGEATVIVFPWLDGYMLPFGPVTIEQARHIGAVLGRIHALDLQVPGLPLPVFSTYADAHWEALVRQAASASMEWADDPASLLIELRAWNGLAQEGYAGVGSRWVVSHGDLDQKNVLWQDDETPYLIDWESAGLVNPVLEVIGAALSWSGQTIGPPEQAVFTALLREYCRHADLPAGVGRAALQGCVGQLAALAGTQHAPRAAALRRGCGWTSSRRTRGEANLDPAARACRQPGNVGELALNCGHVWMSKFN